MKRLVFVIILLPILAGLLFSEGGDPAQTARKVQKLVFSGKYGEAEPLVRGILKARPEDLYYLSQLDIVLNGLKKYQEANRTRDLIRKIWRKKHRDAWIAAGSPVSRSSWARMLVPVKGGMIAGTEYFEPQKKGKDFVITSYYKFIVFYRDRSRRTRLFKLEMSELTQKFHVLRESYRGGGRQVIAYGPSLPEFRKVMADLKGFLDK